jgi:hypothetical protein
VSVPTGYLQASLCDEFAECSGIGGISLKERANVTHLVQHKPVVWILLKKIKRLEDIGKTNFQIFFPRFEDGSLPMRVRNDQYNVWLRCLCGGGVP